VTGWHSLEGPSRYPDSFTPDDQPRQRSAPALFHFGYTAKPNLVQHSHQAPGGPSLDHVLDRLQPGDLHWNTARRDGPNMHGARFAPWNAGPRCSPTTKRVLAPGCALERWPDSASPPLCDPPTVWRLFMQETLGDYPVRLREVSQRRRATESEVIRAGRAPGRRSATGTVRRRRRRSWAITREKLKPEHGPAIAGIHGGVARQRGQPATMGNLLDLSVRPVGLMQAT